MPSAHPACGRYCRRALTLIGVAALSTIAAAQEPVAPVALLRLQPELGTVTPLRFASVEDFDLPATLRKLAPDELLLVWSEEAFYAPIPKRATGPPGLSAAQPVSLITIEATEDLRDSLPAAFALRLRRADTPRARPLGERIETFSERLLASAGALTMAPCLARGEVWRCACPQGVFDVAVQIGDRVERLWRAVELGAGGATLQLPEQRGLRLAGSIEPADTRVLLLPRMLGADRGQVDRLRARLVTAAADGSFRFTGVRRGPYQLVYEADGLGRKIVDVDLGADTYLDHHTLSSPASVVLALDPPTAYDGTPWSVRLMPAAGGGHATSSLDTAADAQGWVQLGALAAAEYRLMVSDRDGSRWLLDDLAVAGGDELLSVQIPHVEIAGNARAGDQPLAGTLVFGTSVGVRSVRVALEDDGSFGGYLPREGTWSVELAEAPASCRRCGGETAVQLDAVEVETGPSGKAILELRLPDTEVRGEVVEARGEAFEPAAGAWINGVRFPDSNDRPPNELRTVTADDGTFTVRGVDPGPLQLYATGGDGDAQSPFVGVHVAEGVETPPVRLVLRRMTTIAIQLQSPDGAVGGATVTARPVLEETGGGFTTASAYSRADGIAELDVPADVFAFDLLITHPTYASWLGRVQLGAGPSPSPPGVSLVPSGDGATLAVLLPAAVLDDGFWEGGYLSAGGAPFSHRELFVGLRGTVAVDNERILRLSGLSPGPYTYCATYPAVACHELTLAPGTEARIELDTDDTADPEPTGGSLR